MFLPFLVNGTEHLTSSTAGDENPSGRQHTQSENTQRVTSEGNRK